MTTIHQAFEDSELCPSDTETLATIHAKLDAAGLKPHLTDFGTVVVEFEQFGQPYAQGIFVSAREVFYEDDELKEYCTRTRRTLPETLMRKFWSRQNHWLSYLEATKYQRTSQRTSRYLVIVDPDGRTRDQYAALAVQAELDERGVKKFVCDLESMADVLANPFVVKAERANRHPMAYFSRDTLHSFEEPPKPEYTSTVTAQFEPHQLHKLVDELACHPQAATMRKMVGTLFQHILGSDYQVVDGDEWPEVSRTGMSDSLPLFYLSKGEQLVMAYCLFLTLQYKAMAPNQCLGIKNALTSLDTVRLSNALDCLSNFVIATGASVYIRADKQQYSEFAKRKLDTAMSIARAAPHRH
jgi:hypothetical protein